MEKPALNLSTESSDGSPNGAKKSQRGWLILAISLAVIFVIGFCTLIAIVGKTNAENRAAQMAASNSWKTVILSGSSYKGMLELIDTRTGCHYLVFTGTYDATSYGLLVVNRDGTPFCDPVN